MSAGLLGFNSRKWRNRVNDGASAWNPSDKGANIALSGTLNVIATGGVAAWQSVRSVTSHLTGKWFFEVQRTTDGGGNLTVAGVCDATASLATYLGNASGNSEAIQLGNGTNLKCGLFASSNSQTGGTAIGSAILFALDCSTRYGWFLMDTTKLWAGGGNPSAGTSPSFTWSSALTLFAGCSVYGGTAVQTLNTGQRAFQNASYLPAGFKAWG